MARAVVVAMVRSVGSKKCLGAMEVGLKVARDLGVGVHLQWERSGDNSGSGGGIWEWQQQAMLTDDGHGQWGPKTLNSAAGHNFQLPVT